MQIVHSIHSGWVWAAVAGLLFVGGCASDESPVPSEVPPEVVTSAYVGDASCASCHEDLYTSYHRTGMGRSMSRFDVATAPEEFEGHGLPVYDASLDFYYTAFVRSDTMFQREYRLGPEGAVVYEQEYPVAWVVGSGHATRSYLMDVNGTLTEMPLTWYVKRRRWDLSPGYEQSNQRFDRPINLECMTCHNGRPTHSTFTQSHYTEVPDGITCERCHGPGGDHVDARLAGFEPDAGTPDPDIVNPAHLDRSLELSMCQQCHLSGTTVFKPGEDPTTYRPGTPLAVHRTVFATQEELTDPEQFGIASHAARLAQSVCYEASTMTCTTCHDPHVPVAELEADHFNTVCASCHTAGEGEVFCSRDEAHSAAEAMTGDCVACHMQVSGTSDIPHVTFTDHWIRRTIPASRRPEEIDRTMARTEPLELVPMEDQAEGPPEGMRSLEEAIAYFEVYETRHRLPDYLPRVVDLAREGLAAGADHPLARIAMGRALADQDSLQAAEQALAEAVEAYPEDARVLYWLGTIRARAEQAEAAMPVLEKAVAIQPAFTEAHIKLAGVYQIAGRTADAEAAYRKALAQDPVHHPDAWNDLGFLQLQQNRLDEAQSSFDRALALAPDLGIALVNRGSLELMRGSFDAAIPYFEHAVAVDSLNVAALGNLGLAYAQVGQYEKARQRFQQILTLMPGNQRARAALEQLEALQKETS